MIQEVQLCRDCKHCQRVPSFPKCYAHSKSSLKAQKLVGAGSYTAYYYAVTIREVKYHNSPICPKFEPRVSWFRRIKEWFV